MGKIYLGQTKLELRLETGQDITGATVVIKYRKPDRSIGEFEASITDATVGTISYFVSSADDFDQVGTWTFWAYATFPDDKIAAGEPVKVQIYDEGL